jgi:type VI secretion system protein ImpJ
MGAADSWIFDDYGGTIGRDKGNNWVLPDYYISRRHAIVHCIHGEFFIESIGANAIGIKAPDTLLERGVLHRLIDGDHLFIGDFEILAQLIDEASGPRAEAPPANASFVDLPSDSAVTSERVSAPNPCDDVNWCGIRSKNMDESFSILPNWCGFTELQIDPELLKSGRIGLARARGVLPDGTPFQIPEFEQPPAPVVVVPERSGQILFLARSLPAPQHTRVTDFGDAVRDVPPLLGRQDNVTDFATTPSLKVAPLLLRFLSGSEPTKGFAGIPVARVGEVRGDQHVVLDKQFIPTVLDVRAASVLVAFMAELRGLLHQRGEALATRVGATGRGGAAEISDLLMLQAINRYEPVAADLSSSVRVHPRDLYRFCIAVAGELATFTTTSKRPVAIPAYSHEQLRETFDPVIGALRAAFGSVLGQSAIAIPIESKRYGLSVATIGDRTLFGSAEFVLAIRSDMPSDELRRRLAAQLKIGPIDKISQLVNTQSPGIALQAIARAPGHIPQHAGSLYFELDQESELWGQSKASGGVALHMADEIPGLKMELWAKRAPPALATGAMPRRFAAASPVRGPPRFGDEWAKPFLDTESDHADSLEFLGGLDTRAVAPAPNAAGVTQVAPSTPAVPEPLDSVAKPQPPPQPATIHAKLGGPDRPRHEPTPPSRIQMTAFGPSQIRRRKSFFLQTIFHLIGADEKASALARVVDPQPAIAQKLALPGTVSDGEIITVRLLANSRVRVDEFTQTLQWRGETVAAQFSIELPWIDWRSEYLFTIEVDIGGCPVGRCKFRLSIGRKEAGETERRVFGSLSRYQRAFVSYASEDRSIAADVAQLLEIQGIDYFLDQISQRVGSEWRREIEKHIEDADLFLLCWSRHAANSTWVKKEINWALRTQKSTGDRPEIRPFIIGGPPIPLPPKSLRHLHFNSPTVLLKRPTGSTPTSR